MKPLRWRLTLWFAISLLGVVAILMVSAYWHLDYELRKEKWERTHPSHPDWILHGSFTDQEVRDILGELARFWLVVGIPVVSLTIASGYFIARRSIRPVQQINRQLNRFNAQTISQRIAVPDADPEIRALVNHFNDLLARLQTSFGQLQEYTTQVAHELRTPLQLMRLRIEANAASMKPELAEELEEELARLSNYVETALTIARAEQGRLELNPEPVRLKDFLSDTLEPFGRMAAAEGRRLLWSCPPEAVARVDRSALKQILFNLLSNAVKHGDRDLFLRVRIRQQRILILLGNSVRPKPRTGHTGLGIGLRLVEAIAGQMEYVNLAFRQKNFFWVRLQLPAL